MTDYLIENLDGDHVLHLFAVGDMIHVHTNDRTLPLSEPMARQIVNGLRALLSGQFSRAVTETYLHLEAERAARSTATTSASLSNLKPELDML
jgi:hypothetical protein